MVGHRHRLESLAHLAEHSEGHCLADVNEVLTAATHAAASRAMSGVAEILERIRANGPMRDAQPTLVLALANAVAEATIDFIIRDPDNADAHASAGFDALWRMIA